MTALRRLIAAHRRALLALVLAAVGMNALVPAGTMIAPAAHHGATIILCPETHPLMRALAARPAPADEMAALHAAMGHGEAHAGHHGHSAHAAHHAAMGHAAAAADDPAPDPQPASTASPPQSCAFAGLALAAILAERSAALLPPLAPLPKPIAFAERWQLVAPAYLRPPLRAPPALI
ncbi:MAG: hypothetical protein ACK4IS_07590 [Erythrobacter sp.]